MAMWAWRFQVRFMDRLHLICKESIAWEPRYSLFTGEDTHSAVIIYD